MNQRPRILESDILALICDYLAAHRIPFARTDATESFNRKGQRVCRVASGWPDVTACQPSTGRLCGIECKRAIGGTLSFEQAVCLESLWKAGALVIVARSLDAVIELLRTGKTSPDTLAEIVAALKRGPKPKPARRRARSEVGR
jgi:hypothetical protein